MPFISIWKEVLYFLFGTFISRASLSEEKEPKPGGFHNQLLKLYDILMVLKSPGPKDLVKKLLVHQAFKQPLVTPHPSPLTLRPLPFAPHHSSLVPRPMSLVILPSPGLLVPTSALMRIILNHPADGAFTDRAEFTP